MKVKITADSTCDLSPQLVERYGITITPLSVTLDGVPKRDGIDITPEEIFARVAAGGSIGSTAAVNAAEYESVFSELLRDYDAIVHFTISSDMSACYQNAVIAAETVGNVYPVDSRSLSTGIGQLVLDAAVMAEQGMAAADIKAALDEKKEKLDVSFILDTLEYLHKGGRCSTVAALGANLLSLKPCIEVKNGAMGVGKKYRGALNKCLVKYIKDRLKDRSDIDYSRIFITHSAMREDWVAEAEAAVRACGPFEEVYVTEAGCTISNHCGPNCLGILYYHK